MPVTFECRALKTLPARHGIVAMRVYIRRPRHDGQRLLFTRGSGASQMIWILPLTGDLAVHLQAERLHHPTGGHGTVVLERVGDGPERRIDLDGDWPSPISGRAIARPATAP